MKRAVGVRGLALALVGLGIAGSAVAQMETQSGGARWAVGGLLGGASGTANLGSSVDWRTGWSAGVDLTRWLGRNLGVRGDATFARNDLRGSMAAIPAGSKFNKFSYLGEVVLRRSEGSETKLEPFVLGGLGAVSVHRTSSDSTFTRFAGDVGAGLGYRLGRIGLRAEGRDLMYKFDRYGVNKQQNDIVWAGGVTLNF